jgi:hypothetical protein
MELLIDFLKPMMHSSKLTRVGAQSDGGYVLPELIFSGEPLNLVTFGVGYEFSFEKDLLSREKNSNVVMYDYSCGMFGTIERLWALIKSLEFLRALKVVFHYLRWQIFHILNFKRVRFIAKYISLEGNAQAISFQEMMADWGKIKNGGKSILKIDIERDEYKLLTVDVISAITDNFDVLVMELHGVEDFYSEIKTIHDNFVEGGYFVCHLHHNNYTHYIPSEKLTNCFEISYCSQMLQSAEALKSNNFPKEGLDYPCNRKKKDVSWSV